MNDYVIQTRREQENTLKHAAAIEAMSSTDKVQMIFPFLFFLSVFFNLFFLICFF